MNSIVTLTGITSTCLDELLDGQVMLKRILIEGNFDEIDRSILDLRIANKHLEPAVTFERSFRFRETVQSDHVVQDMRRVGFMPSHLGGILSYCSMNPEEQLKAPIIALGTILRIKGEQRVPCFYGGGRKRGIYALKFGDGWGPGCVFLGQSLT